MKRLTEVPEIIDTGGARGKIFRNTEELSKNKREEWILRRFPAAKLCGVNIWSTTGFGEGDLIANYSGISWARPTMAELIPHNSYIVKVGYAAPFPGYDIDESPVAWLPYPDNEITGNFLEISHTPKPTPERPKAYLEAVKSNKYVVFVKQYYPTHWPELRTFRYRQKRGNFGKAAYQGA